MSAKKFLRNVLGRITEISGIVTSAGAANDGDIPALDATGRLDITLMPVGIAPEVVTAPASENLASGDLINLWNDSGTLKARKADATAAGKEADGFVLAAVTSPADATVYLEGMNTGVSGLTIGAFYFLSAASPGLPTATAPTGSGNVVQSIGKATSATSLQFEPDSTRGIVLA
jgi:hypothetical protein